MNAPSDSQEHALSNACTYFLNGVCRSCTLIDRTEDQYFFEKQKGYDVALVKSPALFHTRNKAKLVVSGTRSHPLLGLQETEILSCPLHTTTINEIVKAIPPLLVQLAIDPYDLKTQRGELKYVLLTHATGTGEVMARFVVRSHGSLGSIRSLAAQLQKKFPLLKVVSANIQPKHTAIIEGEEEILLSEQTTLCDMVGELRFILGPKTFYQVNSSVALALYSKAKIEAQALSPRTILDLFCGIGTFAQFCAGETTRVVGVELSNESIVYAKKSAELNGIHNCEFVAMDAEEYLRQHPDFYADLVIVNPPRRGLGEDICNLLLKLRPKTIFYSSCNPQTLERDIAFLNTDYTVKEKTPFDMFTLSHHVEVFTILRRADILEA